MRSTSRLDSRCSTITLCLSRLGGTSASSLSVNTSGMPLTRRRRRARAMMIGVSADIEGTVYLYIISSATRTATDMQQITGDHDPLGASRQRGDACPAGVTPCQPDAPGFGSPDCERTSRSRWRTTRRFVANSSLFRPPGVSSTCGELGSARLRVNESGVCKRLRGRGRCPSKPIPAAPRCRPAPASPPAVAAKDYCLHTRYIALFFDLQRSPR